MEKYLAVDVGGSALKYAVMDESLKFYSHGKVPIDTSSREPFMAAVADLWKEHGTGCAGMGMSVPGFIDRRRGWAYTGGAFLWVANEPYAQEMSDAIGGAPVTIINDAKAAAMAEIGYGNLKDIPDGVVIVLGTGIGGAIVLNGQVLQGTHFSAGEFSFLRGDYQARDGKQDVFAMTNGIRGLKESIHLASGLENVDGLEAFRLIHEENNEQVLQGVKDFCGHLAFHIYNLQAELDVERFLIGGGISAEPMFLGLVQEAVDQKFADALFPLIAKPEIMLCKYRNDANLIGAVHNFRDVTGRIQ
jgi:predicted NBD/HSP70 family sugar kinase